MKQEKGFTLIELLVAMTIIAILAGLALVSYQGARKSARDGKRKSDLEQIRSGLEMCRNDLGEYPEGTSIGDLPGLCVPYFSMEGLVDPIGTQSYYYKKGGANDYQLCAKLEGDSSGSCDGLCGDIACNYRTDEP